MGNQYTPTPVRPYLSPREREVVALFAQGYDQGEVARALRLSPWTIRAHTRIARSHMEVQTIGALIYRALARGLITVPTPSTAQFALRLNKKELSLVQSIAEGRTMRVAGDRIGRSESTAKQLTLALRKRAGVTNNYELIAVLYAAGILK